MKIISQIATKASGSLGGITAAHNKGGMYFRARSSPTNPASPAQQIVRNALKAQAADWSGVLTAAQRTGWTVYATNQTLPDAFGEPRQIPPMAMFTRSNVSRIQAGLVQVLNAPTTYVLPAFTDPTFTLTAATDTLSTSFTNSDDWATEVGGAMLLYISRPLSIGINFFKGPWTFLDSIDGALVPPVSPASDVAPYNFAAGNKFFVMVRVTRADGRLSSDRIYSGLAA